MKYLLKVGKNQLSPDNPIYKNTEEVETTCGEQGYVKAEYQNTISVYLPHVDFIAIAKRRPKRVTTEGIKVVNIVSALPSDIISKKIKANQKRVDKALEVSQKELASYNKNKDKPKEPVKVKKKTQQINYNGKLFTDVPGINFITRDNLIALYKETGLKKIYAAPTPKAIYTLDRSTQYVTDEYRGLLTGVSSRKYKDLFNHFQPLLRPGATPEFTQTILQGISPIDVFRYMYAFINHDKKLDITKEKITEEFFIPTEEVYQAVTQSWGLDLEEWKQQPKYTTQEATTLIIHILRSRNELTTKDARALDIQAVLELTELGYERFLQDSPIYRSHLLLAIKEIKDAETPKRNHRTALEIARDKEDKELTRKIKQIFKNNILEDEDICVALGITQDRFTEYAARNKDTYATIKDKQSDKQNKNALSKLDLTEVKQVIKDHTTGSIADWAHKLKVPVYILDIYLTKRMLHKGKLNLTHETLREAIEHLKRTETTILTQNKIARRFNMSLGAFRSYLDTYNINYSVALAEATRNVKREEIKKKRQETIEASIKQETVFREKYYKGGLL